MNRLSELINELSKRLNNKQVRGLNGIIDEVADCKIMLEQLEFMFHISNEVSDRQDTKLNRLKELLKRMK